MLAAPRGQASQKLDNRLVHELRTLLLDEVPGAVNEQFAPQSRYGGRECLKCSGARAQRDYGILAAGDEQGGLMDKCAGPGRREPPVAVEVAVPVESAAKSAARKFRRHVVE